MREAQRNVELMWLTGRLAPDFKTIADFKKDDGSIIEFRSVVDAVRCALEVQSGMVERNAGLPPGGASSFAGGFKPAG